MVNTLKESLWNQFGASINMLENAIEVCPDSLWDTDRKFWYNAFHCLFFLDYYLTLNPIGFTPPEPFDCSEFEDRMPNMVYSKPDLINYLRFCEKKCKTVINNLTLETLETHWTNESKTMSYPMLEILLYNLRHLQHHAAQLNLILRQETDSAPEWVFQARKKL